MFKSHPWIRLFFQAIEQHEQILKFIEGTVAEGAPVIPISAQLKYNIEVVCEYITKNIPVPVRDFNSEPRLIIIRSENRQKKYQILNNKLKLSFLWKLPLHELVHPMIDIIQYEQQFITLIFDTQ